MPQGPILPSGSGGWMNNLERADLFICDDAASFLQSGFWGGFKSRFGWEALAFKVEWVTGIIPREELERGIANPKTEFKSLLVLRRTLALNFALAYVPWGPELPAGCYKPEAALADLAAALKEALPKDTAFIRFDLPWQAENAESLPCMPPRFSRSSADIQAPDTVILDLTQSIESLMSQMKAKWRYNARLALKKGVRVYMAGGEKISVFYNLLKETARRDGIAIHSFDYYKTLFEDGLYPGKKPEFRLYMAEHEGDTLAGIVTLFRGREAVYLYGASSNKKRSFMAPYALQLKAMEDAIAAGCEEYDLFGIPPNDDPAHPMAGLYRFKTGFGGKIIHRCGSWDFPCRPFIYRIFNKAETLRKKIKKEFLFKYFSQRN
jgi:lipid II:glycine glycyltransferase (peptidoglycan interpeptide bridge formation enzyme)